MKNNQVNNNTRLIEDLHKSYCDENDIKDISNGWELFVVGTIFKNLSQEEIQAYKDGLSKIDGEKLNSLSHRSNLDSYPILVKGCNEYKTQNGIK